ncbi:hypothetical protein HPB49_023159 [Dermacentor silvarum]|uniref:Uncharacterized protein n=1 Tax=Dermacentor silvarum TaxID=543639 RepID=A0ACB8C5Y6_DERSI|nr:hypothetical protein HPB49_023159 [Dermacentor silvarum]
MTSAAAILNAFGIVTTVRLSHTHDIGGVKKGRAIDDECRVWDMLLKMIVLLVIKLLLSAVNKYKKIDPNRLAVTTWRADGTANLTQEVQGKEIANKGAAGADKLKRRIMKASRMPQLPEEQRKIIRSPRGGLNLNNFSTTVIRKTIVEAAGLTENQAKGDIVCSNFTQNIVVVSTPVSDHAERYVRIKSIAVMEAEYDVSAYETAPHSTCKWNGRRRVN